MQEQSPHLFEPIRANALNISSTILAWIFVNTHLSLSMYFPNFTYFVSGVWRIFSRRSNFRMRNFWKEDWNITSVAVYLIRYLLWDNVKDNVKFFLHKVTNLHESQILKVLLCTRGKSLLESWDTNFLPDWQPPLIFVYLIYFKITWALAILLEHLHKKFEID